MKKLLLALLCTILISCTPEPKQYLNKEELVNTTVKVMTHESEGTGVIVDKVGNKYYIITNAHVLGLAEDVKVEFPFVYYRHEPVKIVKINHREDLALLEISPSKPIQSIVAISCTEESRVFDTVLAVGNGLGLPVFTTKGYITNPGVYVEQLEVLLDNPIFIQHTAPIAPGNSGGPLYLYNNVFGYCLTGINARGAYNVGLAIPIYVVKEFIKNE